MITIKIPTARGFWRAVALFAYRRWARSEPVKPVGVPGNRDPLAPCHAFSPRARQFDDWGDCQTDGHYLCAECAHRSPPDRDLDECTCQRWPTHCADDCPIHGIDDLAP